MTTKHSTTIQNKTSQLIGLLRRPNGGKTATICSKLEWQQHSVRSAISRLRSRGHSIETASAARTGETVYVIRSDERDAV